MVNCTYNFESFDYRSTDTSVTVNINYIRTKDFSIQKRVWVWKGSHAGAKSLGLDSNPGEAFSGRDIQVVLGIGTRGEKIPTQVCVAIEEMERRANVEMERRANVEKKNDDRQ